MRSFDVWIVILLFTILIACIPLERPSEYSCYVNPVSGAPKDLVMEPKVLVVPKLGTATPSPTPNACEIENAQLKDELKSWQHLYYERQAQDETL